MVSQNISKQNKIKTIMINYMVTVFFFFQHKKYKSLNNCPSNVMIFFFKEKICITYHD